jgi:hypothetical protein
MNGTNTKLTRSDLVWVMSLHLSGPYQLFTGRINRFLDFSIYRLLLNSQQRKFSLFGRVIDLVLIARRSRHYAGTRLALPISLLGLTW